ncbi:GNAT family N-acetyltransferase [Bowmanella sp. Y26]|uniref:GNAT family N-acetyltransferase n=1 Tax=Bowmanella yangjiangensis TaxID=2811230 RepID=UPI001BDCEDB3|nr:GNAT family N-acetyltransferase [Bowmanella yangjiangensis]MBT1062348.1 GNAT family N-acetyltransferase [Bowmanella yangjiangensis]
MRLIYAFSQEQIAQVHSLYMQAWWAKERTIEQTTQCVVGSQLCVGLVDHDNNLVGFARVLSDYVFKAIIFDVIVCASKRAGGLGAKLMQAIQAHEDLKQVRHFELYCLPEMASYYEKFGFSTEVGGISLMRQTKELSG